MRWNNAFIPFNWIKNYVFKEWTIFILRLFHKPKIKIGLWKKQFYSVLLLSKYFIDKKYLVNLDDYIQ